MDVSRDQAIAACEQVQEHHRKRYLSVAHWQCWGCVRFGGEPEKRCMHTDSGAWDGCPHVNRMLES
jgi:hypothetical protein